MKLLDEPPPFVFVGSFGLPLEVGVVMFFFTVHWSKNCAMEHSVLHKASRTAPRTWTVTPRPFWNLPLWRTPSPYSVPQSVWLETLIVALVARSIHTSFRKFPSLSRPPKTIISDASSAPVIRLVRLEMTVAPSRGTGHSGTPAAPPGSQLGSTRDHTPWSTWSTPISPWLVRFPSSYWLGSERPKSMNTCWENMSLWFCATTAPYRALGHCGMMFQPLPAVLAITACESPPAHVAFPAMVASHPPKLSKEY